MFFSDRFVASTKEFNDFSKNVPSPYMRKSFELKERPVKAEITLCGLGFYRLWVNGREVTKGILAPYISNPDDIVYYDNYNILPELVVGKNTVGFQLGNGLLNNPGGFVWDFEEAEYRSAPKLAFAIEWTDPNGETHRTEADETVKTAFSPLYFDDLRCGERYDARQEIPGWNLPSFSDERWQCVIPAATPKGDKKLCRAQPVRPTGEVLRPLRVFPGELADYKPDYKKELPALFECPGERRGYIFDFGKNRTGTIRLKIHGYRGQRLEIQFAEYIDRNNKLNYANIKFYPDGYAQRDVFICSGNDDVFIPCFTYHGLSCCLITGLTEEQAKPEILEFLICRSSFRILSDFSCSDQTANTLFSMAQASDLSNFIYFPNDCPHREKNGWTGDAALSAQHLFLNYDCADSIREWLHNIRKAQAQNGSLPGIVPTYRWGYDTGPSWDICLTEMTYRAYRFTGNKEILLENAEAIYRYILYVFSRRDSRGVIGFGLGDWCSVDWKQKASRDFTCSVTVVDLCRKAIYIFEQIGDEEKAAVTAGLLSSLLSAVREAFIDRRSCVADTRCQTSQSMALFYHVFEPEEEDKAFRVLLEIIHENKDFLDVGILGARVLFHVLCERGHAALAYKMINRPEWPSYGHFIAQGLTSLPEEFIRDDGEWDSRNHHMFGDISNLFISRFAGLNYIPDGFDGERISPYDGLILSPSFIPDLDSAEASFESAEGKICVSWKRTDGMISLKVLHPESVPVLLSKSVYFQWENEELHWFPCILSEHKEGRFYAQFNEIVFRPMVISDRCAVKAFFDAMGETSASFFNVDHGNEKRVFSFFENGRPDHVFYVAQLKREIAAIAFTWDNGCAIPWFGVAVRDDLHGKGFGGIMLKYLFDVLQRNHYGGLILRTAEENRKARRLYEKNRFEQIGVHPSGELLYLKRFEL